MPGLTENDFDKEDPTNPGYSQLEYDLYGKLGMTIRKNLKENRFEIVRIKTKEVQYSNASLHGIIRIANDLEGRENTWLKDEPGSPDDPLHRYEK
jgi:hypothetical protein